ncbi:MAG: 2'-5' RNA ligase family protein [Cyclobacteriaceae bacterium]|nr:2'-5' RNA ligase family protein [Cyclobacteriaceae bacterium]
MPEPYHELAQELKVHFSNQYNSRASLNSPPHITLHMPFQWRPGKEKVLTDKLSDFFSACSPVQIHFQNFGCFPPRVLFIDIQKSEPLENLHKKLSRFCRVVLNLFNATHKDNPFHPHVTLAFRDLKKTAFKMAWEEFKNKPFGGEFLAKQIALLKHNGKIWEVFQEFDLGQSI